MINPFGTKTPPGGWVFYQPQLKWTLPNPVSHTVASAATEILKVRRKNPAITLQHRLSTNRQDVEEELIAFNAKRLGVDTTLPKPLPRRLLPQVVEDLAAAVKEAAQDGANLIEWLADGKAVSPDQSSNRAAVCTSCPENDLELAGRWYMVPVSESLRKALEKRSDMKLATPYDEKLGSCRACKCVLPLKVHSPIDRIMKGMTPEKFGRLWEKCWIRSEQ